MGVLKFYPLAVMQEQDFKNADFSAMLAVWGNGNAHRGYLLFYQVTMRLVHARNKHPRYAEGSFEALGVIGAEYRELEQAVLHESLLRQEDEALDVLATCLRFLVESMNASDASQILIKEKFMTFGNYGKAKVA